MPDGKIYREGKRTDLDAIVAMQLSMARETEDWALDPETLRKGVEAVFENRTLGAYHVCEIDGQVAACTLLTSEWSDWRNGVIFWIQSVYVLPRFRRKGVYRGLHEWFRSLALNTPSVKGLRLYVEKKNESAQATYRKMGMSDEHYTLFEWMKP